MPFPYVSQIHVNDCFTYQNFDVPENRVEGLKHIIFTGKNGSGKTTILKSVAAQLQQLLQFKKPNQVGHIEGILSANPNHQNVPLWQNEIFILKGTNLSFSGADAQQVIDAADDSVFAYFQANRKVELQNVETVTKDNDIQKKLQESNSREHLTTYFKQYLVNKKVREAFDHMKGEADNIANSLAFFANLQDTLRTILKDPGLNIDFIQDNFEFFLNLSDGRKITFNQLSEGFSAYLTIIMELFMRVDLVRKTKGDFNFDPAGIVVIDEPETHFHLQMQYEVLQLLTSLFPKFQFIVATHSPAIISSIKDAIVYDLSSRSEVKDWLLGSSFSELMIKHFGLDNEFSPVADKIFIEVNAAMQAGDNERLRNILIENAKYLTPALTLEIESQINKINRELNNA